MARQRLMLLAGLALFWPALARADKNDLQLLNLCPRDGAGACSWVHRDANTGQTAVTLDPDAATRYRSLMSELGVVMAPHLMTPADTLGYAGFQVSAELGFMAINPNRQVGGQYYWNGVQGVDPNAPNAVRPATTLTTVGGFVRKGLWLPIPALEFGVGAVSLLGSHMYAIQGYAKFALQEGFHDWVLPSFAVRGSASQLLGTSDVTMTVYGIDLLISKAFSLGGTARIEPFLGWNVLFIDARSGVIDGTPKCDAYAQFQTPRGTMMTPGGCNPGDDGTWGDLGANFTFPSQDVIIRYRWTAGAKLKLSVLFVAAELEFIQHGSTHDSNADAADASGSQTGGSISAGFDF
jgi:hypothetical protein